MQAPQSDQTPFVQVRAWVPQLPQPWVAGPLQVCPPQDPHWQLALQVCMPPIPQVCMAPGAQAPSFAQGDQLDHTPLSQLRVWEPQLPQAWLLGPTQLWPVQLPHWQAEPQLWVPFIPQGWTAPG